MSYYNYITKKINGYCRLKEELLGYYRNIKLLIVFY